jgi:hypothetical protein
MLALLVYCYANGLFSSRRIERATHRDLGVGFVAANLHPDHDTVAAFRRTNKAAFEAAFLQVLLARECGLLRVGTAPIDGTKIDANTSKLRSVRYDRAQALRAKLATDIADLTAQAEAADAAALPDPQALPAEIAQRAALRTKLDAACARLEVRRVRLRRRPGRTMRPAKPPGTPRRGSEARRRSRPRATRQPSGRAT